MYRKPTLTLDFDGVIHSYTSGWKGVGQCPDPIVPGFDMWVLEAWRSFDLNVYSARSVALEGRRAMAEYLRKSGLNTDMFSFPTHKPAAHVSIDDRGLNFNGNWQDPMYSVQALKAFKPWNK